MTAPLNISSDDAAFFQANTPSGTGPDPDPMASDDGDDTEDPIGRGMSRASKVDMFISKPVKHARQVRGSHAQPSRSIRFTPGADLIP